jgi:hypothetical protein
MKISSLGFAYSEEGISGVLARNGLIPTESGTEFQGLVDLPAVMDHERTVWLLLPSGRVVREQSSVKPKSVTVLSGPIENRRIMDGFPATSLRSYTTQDLAVLETSNLYE